MSYTLALLWIVSEGSLPSVTKKADCLKQPAFDLMIRSINA